MLFQVILARAIMKGARIMPDGPFATIVIHQGMATGPYTGGTARKDASMRDASTSGFRPVRPWTAP